MSCTLDVLRDMGYAPRAEIMAETARFMFETIAEQKRKALSLERSEEEARMQNMRYEATYERRRYVLGYFLAIYNITEEQFNALRNTEYPKNCFPDFENGFGNFKEGIMFANKQHLNNLYTQQEENAVLVKQIAEMQSVIKKHHLQRFFK